MKAPAPSSDSWRAPYARAQRALVRTGRRLHRAEQIVAMRESFLQSYFFLHREIHSPELIRVLRGLAPAGAGFHQTRNALREARDELQRTHHCTRDFPDAAVRERVLDGLFQLQALQRRLALVHRKLRAFAFFHSNLDAFQGIVLPAPLPDGAPERRRRLAAAAPSVPPRRLRRRGPPKQTTLVRRVTRGRAPPPPLFSLQV